MVVGGGTWWLVVGDWYLVIRGKDRPLPKQEKALNWDENDKMDSSPQIGGKSLARPLKIFGKTSQNLCNTTQNLWQDLSNWRKIFGKTCVGGIMRVWPSRRTQVVRTITNAQRSENEMDIFKALSCWEDVSPDKSAIGTEMASALAVLHDPQSRLKFGWVVTNLHTFTVLSIFNQICPCHPNLSICYTIFSILAKSVHFYQNLPILSKSVNFYHNPSIFTSSSLLSPSSSISSEFEDCNFDESR